MAKPYPRSTIGEHLVRYDLVFHKNTTCKEALATIKAREREWPDTEQIFVIDEGKKLIGSVNFKTLIASDWHTHLSSIMRRDFISVTDHAHQKTIARLAIKTGLANVPVTDADGRYLGIVDSTQILRILHEQHVDDLMRFSGVLGSEKLYNLFKTTISDSIRIRIPWLIIGLIGGIFISRIIEQFSGKLEQELSLAAFIPLIVYISDAAGTQTQTLYVRAASLEQIRFKRYVIEELKIGLSIGFVVAILAVLIISSFYGISSRLPYIVGVSMFLGITTSGVVATTISWLIDRSGKDPALGSGPFATVIQDFLSVLIYFITATLLLG